MVLKIFLSLSEVETTRIFSGPSGKYSSRSLSEAETTGQKKRLSFFQDRRIKTKRKTNYIFKREILQLQSFL